MPAQSGLNYLEKTSLNQEKSIERMNSGYQVNKAADDAAGVAISVKIRAQILGLLRSSKNTEESISFVQVADGAMSQVSDILQRMRELGVQSLNDTNTDSERADIQKEIDQLLEEIDRLNKDTEFNKQRVFENFDGNYYSYNGNRYWKDTTIHTIDDTNNTLNIRFTEKEGGEEQEIEIEIEKGSYTTQDLVETINAALDEAYPSQCFELKYQSDSICQLALYDGEKIKDVSGGLTYLFTGGYGGTEPVSLLGTTIFYPGYPLTVVTGKNDELSFDIERYDDTVQHVDIKTIAVRK